MTPARTLPAYQEARERVAAGTSTALDRLVAKMEPSSRGGSILFRDLLADVLREARGE